MTNGKVFWGIVVAAAAGTVIGMLFAPEEGTNTRKRIKRSANDWATDMLDKLEQGKTKVRDAASRLNTQSQELRDRAYNTVEGGLDSAREAVHKTRTTETAGTTGSTGTTGTTGTTGYTGTGTTGTTGTDTGI
ncbi:YtxH domain-containing protein [Telluribacter sp. SYSU D00476]|uniref:YtxH domain-containing protein n=1 Tax=Telluribacter sp. SYSU D00476 TaxID=2811430 RepID=UPI001FF518D0|nr:YtxH domain-containing protein [Telluribacter sp. SYSU D00476]